MLRSVAFSPDGHSLASTLIRKNTPALLLTLGGHERVFPLRGTPDLIPIWTQRTSE